MLESKVWLPALASLVYLFTPLESKVFLDQNDAEQLLRRVRKPRANYFLEEVLPGNLERECYEEVCSQEEAAEIFQTQEKTMEFWYRYKNLNPCQHNPCLNGGICGVDRDSFICLCPPQYEGKTCNTEIFECQYRNGGCLQYCEDKGKREGVQCTCADGYQLDADGRSCSKTVLYPCGKKQNVAFYRRNRKEELPPTAMLDPLPTTMLDPLPTTMLDPLPTSMLDPLPNIMSDPLPNTMSDPLPNTMLDPLPNTMLDPEYLPAFLNISNGSTETNSSVRNVNFTSAWKRKNGTEFSVEDWEQLGETDDLSTRIVGGLLERQGGSPWQVLFHREDGYGFCGGTLISDRWVVSAAHCFEETPDHVTIGDFDKRRPDPDEQLIKVERIVVHPHFHAYTFDSDIALAYLAQPVVLRPSAIPACLPNNHLAKYLTKDEIMGVATGWGAMQYLGRSSRFLRKVSLPVVSQQKCMKSTEQVITDNMFCAGYLEATMDACSGDSGGPFVVSYQDTWYLTGVVSWGEQCAAKGKYGVFTRLGNYLGWIRHTMEQQERNSTQS